MEVCAHRVYHLQIIRRIEMGWIHPPPFPVPERVKETHSLQEREREKNKNSFFLQEKIIGYFSWFLMFLLLLLLLLLPLLLLLLLFLDIFTTVRGSDLEIPFIGCDKTKTYNYSRGSGFKLTSFGSGPKYTRSICGVKNISNSSLKEKGQDYLIWRALS